MDKKHDPVGARVATTVDIIPVQDGELVQLLALAFRGERQSAIVAECVGEAAYYGKKARSVRSGKWEVGWHGENQVTNRVGGQSLVWC